MDFFVFGGQVVVQVGFDFLQQVVDVVLVGGGFQGVYGVVCLLQGFVQVGEVEVVLCLFVFQQGVGEDFVEVFQ